MHRTRDEHIRGSTIVDQGAPLMRRPFKRTALNQKPVIVPLAPLSELGRRSALCLELPFPVLVRGTDVAGYMFEEHSVLSRLSACDLVVQLEHTIECGSTLFLIVRFSIHTAPSAVVALRGTVVHAEPVADLLHRYYIVFKQHRFLYLDNTSRQIRAWLS